VIIVTPAQNTSNELPFKFGECLWVTDPPFEEVFDKMFESFFDRSFFVHNPLKASCLQFLESFNFSRLRQGAPVPLYPPLPELSGQASEQRARNTSLPLPVAGRPHCGFQLVDRRRGASIRYARATSTDRFRRSIKRINPGQMKGSICRMATQIPA
jgi:hypothetical protein